MGAKCPPITFTAVGSRSAMEKNVDGISVDSCLVSQCRRCPILGTASPSLPLYHRSGSPLLTLWVLRERGGGGGGGVVMKWLFWLSGFPFALRRADRRRSREGPRPRWGDARGGGLTDHRAPDEDYGRGRGGAAAGCEAKA